MGCTASDLRSWLPGALPGLTLSIDAAEAACTVPLAQGSLRLTWAPLAPLRIALLEIPRLQVCFVYSGVSNDQRFKVQQRFDLGTQRGGG